jgi:hypothetical protein
VSVFKRLASPLYDQRKALIQDQFLLEAFELAEEAVLVDPSRPPVRRDRIEIDGIIYDAGTLGVMLAYEIEGDGVRFLSFADLWNS